MAHHSTSAFKINRPAPLLFNNTVDFTMPFRDFLLFVTKTLSLSAFFWIINFFLFSPAGWAKDLGIQHQRLVGTAFDKDHKIYYVETNRIELKEGKILKIDSFYKNKDKKLIVEIHSDFTNDPYIPETYFIDFRKNIEYKLSYLKKDKKVSIMRKVNGTWTTKNLDYRDGMTNSVGLINYIRENLSQLKSQGKKNFRYIVAALNDDFGMDLSYHSGAASKLYDFSFRLQNFFVRNLSGVAESHLTFNEETRAMKSFQGVSNILNESNKAVEVTINYDDPVTD